MPHYRATRTFAFAWAAILIAACVAPDATAQVSGGALVPGFGQDSCGQWAESRRTNSTDWSHEVAWVQGFVSGQNFYATDPKMKSFLAEPPEVALWLDRFCNANPLLHVINGAAAYVEAKGGPKPVFPWKRP